MAQIGAEADGVLEAIVASPIENGEVPKNLPVFQELGIENRYFFLGRFTVG